MRGDTWTWTYQKRAGDEPVNVRSTIVEASPSRQLYRSKVSPDARSWSVALERELTRVE